MVTAKKATAQDGHIDIDLARPLAIAGAQVKSLRMREPTVADQLASQEGNGSEGEREIAMFANLCMVTPDDIKALTLRDYRRVQAAFVGFLD